MESRIFLHSKVSLEKAKSSGHNPNIKQWREGVKKEQVKGCGSVNRPTPGSQRPAEPVATGFFGGFNRAEKCGSVKGAWGQAVGRGCPISPV